MNFIVTSIVVVCAICVYLFWLRPWQLRWGATNAEVVRTMTGDDIVPKPTFNATRAVTVEACPEDLWPWLVQIGCKRAGWYSYDWIDNLGIRSADRILPELQQIYAGQLIPLSPDGRVGLYVRDFATDRWILWVDKKNESTWYWGLYPTDSNSTRLITRVHLKYRWFSPAIIFSLLLDVGDIIMMRKCMLGIKRRAELLAKERTA